MITYQKIYFASDQHFGAPTRAASLPREEKFINWLDEIKKDADVLFLLGDLFDFWFEYEEVVPKGFVRVLGKLAELKDAGIEMHFFIGNHDLWMHGYFENELGIPVYHEPKEFILNGKSFLIGHGDGLGPGDKGYKYMKKVFTNPVSKFLYRWLHPDLGMKLGHYLSVKNRLISGNEDVKFLGEDEWLLIYCKEKLAIKQYDFFIFGHRHLPMIIDINEKSKYINSGDWITHFSYLVLKENEVKLKKYE